MNDRIWQAGEVIAACDNRVRVRLSRTSGCARCLAGQGCGAGVFSQLFSRRSVHVDVANTIGAIAGQQVMVGVAPSALAAAATRVYGMPLLGFVAGVLLVTLGLPVDSASSVWGDLIALAAGLVAASGVFVLLARSPLVGLRPELRHASCRAP